MEVEGESDEDDEWLNEDEREEEGSKETGEEVGLGVSDAFDRTDLETENAYEQDESKYK